MIASAGGRIVSTPVSDSVAARIIGPSMLAPNSLILTAPHHPAVAQNSMIAI